MALDLHSDRATGDCASRAGDAEYPAADEAARWADLYQRALTIAATAIHERDQWRDESEACAGERDDLAVRLNARLEICDAHMALISGYRRQNAAYRRLLRRDRPWRGPEQPSVDEVIGRVVALRPLGDGSGQVGDCPFCGEADALHVFADFYGWACSACEACGGWGDFVDRWAPQLAATGGQR